MCGRRKGGRRRPHVPALAALKKPSVKLYRGLELTNDALPGCKFYIRAYPFIGQKFHKFNRQDCIAAVPEEIPVADASGGFRMQKVSVRDFQYGKHKADAWVGRVICFMECWVRTGIDAEERRSLAFVQWADTYQTHDNEGGPPDRESPPVEAGVRT
jgi:hypothetical protein